ncbi:MULTISPECIES: RNA polymerase sigma factor [unclassified Shinella]|uniref:RNA polymerase sigma factor n=1 Tax=unclassified Shinella TaxID=2643062 RepID=UPI00225CC174|nr:sigma-70 family RNA polymerase sigma factor [Shinella sp. YE25]MDC7259441.1 sigma-70 family RNA polymerase sigma factor [Shinella sp. YE25]CAI0341472.1 Sigma-70 family RNA polymerase sigma factor [Rhizobiaceae bacterium]CAK7261101.1 RNA polymerase sigma-70 factor, ECF subfamily [Shinella sp. WSC3-e]
MSQARAQEIARLPERLDDEVLLARVAAGEQLALRQLIDRHGRGLRLFAGRYLGNSDEAEDVVQDVFIAVWKNAKRFDRSKGRATTWIYRIAANRCIDVRRWRKFRIFIGFEEAHERFPSEDPDLDSWMGARQELAIVRAGLEKLPERQRMALLLRAVADLDVPAIAEVMDASAGSVEQLLVRARRTLRAQLSEVGTAEPQNERKTR